MTGHIWTGFWFLANDERWRGLPKDVAEIIARNIEAASITQRTQSELANTALLAKLRSQGMIVNAPAQQPFKDALKSAGFYKDWRAKFGLKAWDLLEKTTGALG